MANLTTGFYHLKGGVDKESGKFYLGRVRIFINCDFNSVILENIPDCSAEADIKAIKNSFEKLNFKVDQPIKNKKAEEMIQCFQEDIDYFGCVVIFVFSHGEQDMIYGTDGKIVNVWHDFYPQFGRKPEMKEYPKVFINEWCQSGHDEKTPTGLKRSESHQNEKPDHWLICNAALPHCEAFSEEDDGSIFTQVLCRYLDQCAGTKDLDDIFRLVREEVSKKKLVLVDKTFRYIKPIVSSTLVHKLYLLNEPNVIDLRKVKSYYQTEFEQIAILYELENVAVMKVTQVSDARHYAIKRVEMRESFPDSKILQEIRALSTFTNCSNIVCYKYHWKEAQIWYIQMELCEKTLEQWLNENMQREKSFSLNIFRQIVKGLSFVHKEKFVHGDIKPSNILLVNMNTIGDNCVRIADFGLTRYVDEASNSTHISASPPYMAPEIWLNKFVIQSDLYSTGLVLIELLCNCCGDHHDDILNKSKEKEYPSPFQHEMEFAVPLLNQLLMKEWSDRPTSDELLQTISSDADWNEGRWQFESTCTIVNYEVNEAYHHNETAELEWNEYKDDWLPLFDGNVWKVKFTLRNEYEFTLVLKCCSADQQFLAAFRAFAELVKHPLVWMETAGVLRSGEVWRTRFSKNLSELPCAQVRKVRIKVCWTQLSQPTSIVLRSNENFQCRWMLHGWSAANPSGKWWQLWSARFGKNGAVWRLFVNNRRKEKGRELVAGLHLQSVSKLFHYPFKFRCSLTVWEKTFEVKEKIMSEISHPLEWTIVDNVTPELLNTLDLTCVLTLIDSGK